MVQPLLIHLIFHPASKEARSLAIDLHGAFNDDPILPGLRLPTVVVPEDGTNAAPTRYDLNGAERSVVIVLADDNMAADRPPAGRVSWPEFVADLADRCGDDRHRFLPVQLSQYAWPLHARLEGTNFIRAWGEPAGNRTAWTERRIVIEICRFLLGEKRGEQAPVRIFLSHAKQDINTEPKLFDALVQHLNATQPVSTWVDSGKIEAGKDFGSAIEAGICDSAVLVLETTNYSSRPWCRRELLVAKQLARPVVVVDGLKGLDVRSFPYSGNVPVMAWAQDGAQRAVDLLLKEWLRHLYMRKLLEGQKRPKDCVLPAPPELATIVALPGNSAVLYPDPPLGDEELAILAPLGHSIETPLQRAGSDRTLREKKIALSISASDAIEAAGLLLAHLDQAFLEISRYLLVKGATLVYGGNLGSGGYTTALFELVRAHQSQSGLPPAERIVNYVGWPTPFPLDKRAEFSQQASFVRIARPAGIAAFEPETFVEEPGFFAPTNPARRYAWSRGMTAMRELQTANIAARIVLGGKAGPSITTLPNGEKQTTWYNGRVPGVLEEALLSLKAKQPVYLCGGFGGVAAMLGELLQGRVPEQFTWDYQRQAPYSDELRALYKQDGIAWEDYGEQAQMCKDIGLAGLSRCNHLSEDQNLELLGSRDLQRIIALLLDGLTRALV